MHHFYPIRFRPIFRRYIWGGRRLAEVLNKDIGDGDDYAESWEIVDHGDDQSVVQYGELKGVTLGELVRNHGQQLLGIHHPQPCFPLLFKFLDANRVLSVQVHPDDEMGRSLDPPDLGKTEAWVIIDAAPGSVLYAGLNHGVDRHSFARHVADGTVEECLHRIKPNPGDCIFVKAGTVHALGAGLLVAEIQQASDTTFRLFDWNRVDRDGNPRALHVDQGLDAIDFGRGPVTVTVPASTARPFADQLVNCDKFVLERWQIEAPQSLGGDDRCHILVLLAGEVTLEDDPAGIPLSRGQTAIIPAACDQTTITPNGAATLLKIHLR